MRHFRSGLAVKWLAAGMIAMGAILVVVSWHTIVHGPQSPVHSAQNKEGTANPMVIPALLPTASEPLIPTRTSTPLMQGEPSFAASPSPHPTERAEGAAIPAFSIPISIPRETIEYLPLRARFGVGVAISSLAQLDPRGQLGVGWYLNWKVELHPSCPQGMEFAQMVRVDHGSYKPDLATIGAVADANPGSLWLIGNEPDVKWQDDATPEEYARVYHELYGFLKGRDPTCQVAIAGVSQPTPLRLQYLEMILETYEWLYGERMPVDVWNVHGFVLREERNSWGVDIPPGLSATSGALYEVQDHDALEIFTRQIVAFRRWMRDRGERNKPLVISEYGILMPQDYGFPLERVRDFMYGTFNYFLTATDEELGYPPDDDRLVQRWAWYSLSDRRYPTGNLVDPDTQEFTPLGLAYQEFVGEGG